MKTRTALQPQKHRLQDEEYKTALLTTAMPTDAEASQGNERQILKGLKDDLRPDEQSASEQKSPWGPSR